MGIKRLLLELLVALLLARFAMVIGSAYAQDTSCSQGLPALASQGVIPEHDSKGGCPAPSGSRGMPVSGGSDGQ